MTNLLSDCIANFRSAIAYSKRPGNEGQTLANAKGVYRPVSEVLTPGISQLEALELLLADLGTLTTNNFGVESKILGSVKFALDAYASNVNPVHSHANALKASFLKGKGL